MIILKNKIISIYRHIETEWKSEYWLLESWIEAFIYPLSEDVLLWDTWIPAYKWHKMLSDYSNIQEWDQIIDQNWIEYIVKWSKNYDNIIEKHTESILINNYDE